MQFIRLGMALLIAAMAGSAWAEIYETTDEQGNKVFTDAPSGEAKVVDLPEANIADSVEPAPRAAPSKTPSKTPSGTPSAARPGAQSGESQDDDDDGVYIIGDANNDRLEEKMERERRQEVLEGERPHEVLDATPPRDIEKADHIKQQAPAQHRAPSVHRR